MNWDDVVTLSRQFPLVHEATSYGTPALKVRNKLLLRLRPEIDALVVLGVVADERAGLIATQPQTFFAEPHYEPCDIVLARLENLRADQLVMFLERYWRTLATKSAIQAFDAGRVSPSP